MEVDTLDTFRPCDVAGCLWRVQSLEPVRCFEHDGPAHVPQYAESEEGDILDCRFIDCPDDGGEAA